MPLYLFLLIGSVVVPALFSVFFIDFIKKWKAFTVSTLVVAVVFLIWDAVFTKHGVWGFNPVYCLGIDIVKMPIEEWLFFVIIPFCSLFTHFAFFYKFPKVKLKKDTAIVFTLLLMIVCFVLMLTNYRRAYTFVNYSFLLITLALGLLYAKPLLQRFYISFLIICIPFFLVNGALTGMFTEQPVVWYDDLENLGVRIITIPVEDIGYAFTMLFGNLMVFDRIKNRI